MAKYNDAHKEVWQTERAIEGVRGGFVYGGIQAVRCLVQRNLLETFGIPSAHNNHYYLNQGGYSAVPSYLWESAGPHPAALALRTRAALTKGTQYAGEIDFGVTGNKMLLGLRFEFAAGSVVSVENFGTADMAYEAEVKGAEAVEIVDSFGNVTSRPVTNGKLALAIPQLPIYLRLKPGQTISFPQLDPGRNIAPAAQITYSAKSDSDIHILQNGVLETHQSGNPNGDPGGNGIGIWSGDILEPGHPTGNFAGGDG